MLISGAILASVAGPIPETCRRSSAVRKGPTPSLCSMIRRARAGPTPGRRSSSTSEARLGSSFSPAASGVPLLSCSETSALVLARSSCGKGSGGRRGGSIRISQPNRRSPAMSRTPNVRMTERRSSSDIPTKSGTSTGGRMARCAARRRCQKGSRRFPVSRPIGPASKSIRPHTPSWNWVNPSWAPVKDLRSTIPTCPPTSIP